MPIVKTSDDDDPFWHEKELMVQILSRGPVSKRDLFNKLTQEQRRKTFLGEKGLAHCRSTYNNWVSSRKSQWVISEHEGTLELTPLGKWIGNSTLCTFFERDHLISLICGQCAAPADLVFLKPLMHTAETNAKGRLFMDLQCPRCRHYVNRMPLSEVLSKEGFRELYNKALKELSGIVTGQSLIGH